MVLSLCEDNSPSVGLRRAISLLSESSNDSLSARQWHSVRLCIFSVALLVVWFGVGREEFSRLATLSGTTIAVRAEFLSVWMPVVSAPCPYVTQVLHKNPKAFQESPNVEPTIEDVCVVFEECGVHPQDTLSLAEFCGSLLGSEIFEECKLYKRVGMFCV